MVTDKKKGWIWFMKYDPVMEAQLAMLIGLCTGDDSEGLETVQHNEQCRARSSDMLPQDMQPSKKFYETLGFAFEDVGDSVLYQASLPNGWTLKSAGGCWTDLLDEKGRKRGSYFYKGAFYDRNGHMYLVTRYYITYEHIEKNNWRSPIKVYAMDRAGMVLFEAGECEDEYTPEYNELKRAAEVFLDTNYPEWKDVSKYWD